MTKVIGIGVILQTPEGTYLLQERDHNAEVHPGRIAPFGGGMEAGEDALQCAKREMLEELHLILDTCTLETIKVFESRNKPDAHIHMFLAKDIEKSDLTLSEGLSIVEMTKGEALANNKVTDFTKEVMNLLH